MATDFVDRADVGMVEGGGGARLPTKAFERHGVARNLVGQKLERHKAAEFGVLGFEDHTHPAAAKSFQNAVVRNGLPDHQ